MLTRRIHYALDNFGGKRQTHRNAFEESFDVVTKKFRKYTGKTYTLTIEEVGYTMIQ